MEITSLSLYKQQIIAAEEYAKNAIIQYLEDCGGSIDLSDDLADIDVEDIISTPIAVMTDYDNIKECYIRKVYLDANKTIRINGVDCNDLFDEYCDNVAVSYNYADIISFIQGANARGLF